ncbi:MAG: tetratricopeptide repeat protein [Sulfuricurvum sp.]
MFKLFYLSITSAILLASEPSAFGAGDLDQPNPYGLTKAESTILQTKKDLQKISAKSNDQANQVDTLRERIDGVQTIIESLATKSHENRISLKNLEEQSLKDRSNSNEFNNRLAEALGEQSKIAEENSDQIAKINAFLQEITKKIDLLEKRFATKDELKKLSQEVASIKKTASNPEPKPQSNSAISKDNAQNDTEASKAFRSSDYAKAKILYEHLVKENYKPAKSNYMLGEISYYSKNYSEAIAYFKKSASLYDKAEYMPTLLLHTAISMQKSGDESSATSFYNALINNYPDSKEAGIAKSNIKN